MKEAEKIVLELNEAEIYDIYFKGVYIQTTTKFGMIQFFKGWLFANNLIDL